MERETRPARQKVLARRQRVLTLSIAVVVIALTLVMFTGFLATYWLGKRGELDIYLYGKGVDCLEEGAMIVLDIQPVGQVRAIEMQGTRQTAHLVIDQEMSTQIRAGSIFRVESLNDWMPGNVGVRVYAPKDSAQSPPVEDDTVVQASDMFLPPEIPPKFYLLVVGALVVVSVTVALGVAAYRVFHQIGMAIGVFLIGLLVLSIAYQYFSGRISVPGLPTDLIPVSTAPPDSPSPFETIGARSPSQQCVKPRTSESDPPNKGGPVHLELASRGDRHF